jgi:hypothetical protein
MTSAALFNLVDLEDSGRVGRRSPRQTREDGGGKLLLQKTKDQTRSARGRAAVYSNYFCCDKNDCDKEERIWLRTIGQFLQGTT